MIFVHVGVKMGYIDAISKQSRLVHLKETGALVIGEFATEFPEDLAP